jgi:hypothetical protein
MHGFNHVSVASIPSNSWVGTTALIDGQHFAFGHSTFLEREHVHVPFNFATQHLKVKAKALGQTLYDLRDSLFFTYLRTELRNPRIVAC